VAKLTYETLRGIWAGITMCWDENYRFDEKTYAANIQRTLGAKVHGLFTTGSTGEFYALDFDEFRRMVDIEADLCGRVGMPLQIGCCADVTAKTIRLLEYAASKKTVSGVQITLPYWMELTDREMLQFFKDVHSACPDMPLIHYNIPRAKRFLTGPDYLKVLEVAPNLIGVKFTFAGSHFGVLQAALALTPRLSYFVGEDLLVSGMLLGARGSYSSLVATNPQFTLKMFATAEAHQWDEAIALQKLAAKFYADVEAVVVEQCGDGGIDPVFDKGLGVASGCVLGHQRCRSPYIGWKDETVQAVRAWLREKYPQFLYPQ
jgi:dihydrodipicolinate synthase/N-acetylneuraminate lyase